MDQAEREVIAKDLGPNNKVCVPVPVRYFSIWYAILLLFLLFVTVPYLLLSSVEYIPYLHMSSCVFFLSGAEWIRCYSFVFRGLGESVTNKGTFHFMDFLRHLWISA